MFGKSRSFIYYLHTCFQISMILLNGVIIMFPKKTILQVISFILYVFDVYQIIFSYFFIQEAFIGFVFVVLSLCSAGLHLYLFFWIKEALKNVFTIAQVTNENVCCLCGESFTDEFSEPIKLNICSHIFHKNCLVKWLDFKDHCPEC